MKVVIFDNDGVLTNSPEFFATKLIRERNLDSELVESFFINIFIPKCMTGKADLKIELAKVLPSWEIKDNVDSILKDWFECENHIDERVRDLIVQLGNNDIECYLATNQDKYRTNYMITEMGFGNLFKGIFSSAIVGHKKPSEEFYKKVFTGINKGNLGLRVDEIFYVDDDEKNVIAGREFGFDSFHYKNFKDLENKLKKLQLISN